jgi:hypothetical protein
VVSWGRSGYGALDTEASMRPLIVAMLLIAAGVQTIFASFVMSMLGIRETVVRTSPVVLEPGDEAEVIGVAPLIPRRAAAGRR